MNDTRFANGWAAPVVSNRGFTLIEIAIAVGIFAFAVIGVVFLLGQGLRAAVETQRDSAQATALISASANIRSAPESTTNLTLYFDEQGSPQEQSADALYRIELESAGDGGLGDSVDVWTARITGPLPSTNTLGRFVLSRNSP